jgi:penicillin-insensitive murein endopeptidase
MIVRSYLSVALAILVPQGAMAESRCFGTVSKGRLEAGVKLPVSGPNFEAYSAVGAMAGRTHVHSKVAEVVVAAYAAVAAVDPGVTFVYGESGWPSGGRFRPHRTHQNGLSVDFFVPVRDRSLKSVPLPIGAANKFGYNIEFDSKANYGEYTIDFKAIGEHLYQLDVAAKRRGSDIALVIFDEQYLPRLFETARGAYLKQNIRFMKGKPWVRHDEHYHVDFTAACKTDAS